MKSLYFHMYKAVVIADFDGAAFGCTGRIHHVDTLSVGRNITLCNNFTILVFYSDGNGVDILTGSDGDDVSISCRVYLYFSVCLCCW